VIVIDGSQGEGGGQILRSALSLSMATGRPFRIDNIRANRGKPGLLRQHLTAVRAAKAVSGARVSGDELGSASLIFEPDEIRAGDYDFAIGSAGSTILVLQTVLPALMLVKGASRVALAGGTHNQAAPPFEFVERAYLPVLAKMGVASTATLTRRGFYPAGGGALSVEVTPSGPPKPIELPSRGAPGRRYAEAVFANLAADIAKRELTVVKEVLGFADDELLVRGVKDSRGPGNVLLITFESETLTEVFAGFGERGVSAERVARGAANEARRYLAADVAVGPHLADQLLLPMALAGGGRFTTVAPSRHTRTNIETIRLFLDVDIACRETGGKAWEIEVTSDSASTG